MMSVASHYQERQDEEFQALEAIFGSDLEDLRQKAAWKVARPLELKLTLKPQQSTGGQDQKYVQLDMLVKCPARYPDVVPDITLANWKGLSDTLVAGLKLQLVKEAADNIGEVMLWQLANTVQEFLHKHNKPPPQSFYEQMINNKKRKQERIQEEERIKEEKRRHQLEEEAKIRQEVLRNETRRRKEDQKNSEYHTPVLPAGSATMSKGGPTFSSPLPIVAKQATETKEAKGAAFNQSPTTTPGVTPVKCTSPGVTPVRSGSTPPSGTFVSGPRRKRRTSTPRRDEEDDLDFSPCKDHVYGVSTLTFKGDRNVQRGKCLGHGRSGCSVYAGMDSSTGELVAVAEWVLQWRQLTKKAAGISAVGNPDDDTEGQNFLKQLTTIEKEFNSLQKLNHPNLIHYLAWKHQYQPGKITVHVMMEYSGGTNLAVYIQQRTPIPLDSLQNFVKELLEALKYLHHNSIVHKNLRASSMFIDSGGRLRLADYSIDKRLGDLYEAADHGRPGVRFSDERPMVIGRGGQKGDIYQLGLVILTLALGQPLIESIPDVPTHLPPVLQDFLNKCLLRDERQRWTAGKLLDHSFVKEQLYICPAGGDSGAANGKTSDQAKGDPEGKEEVKDDEEDDSNEYLSTLVASGQSRLASEFDLLKVLGKGGFGDVLKVKNKLDGRFYAIKRIPLNPKSRMFNRKMKREVKLLSRLNHENVVRYYCSWIEISDDPAHSETSSSMTPSSVSKAPQTSDGLLEPTPKGGGGQGGRKGHHIVRSIPLTKTPVIKSANCSFEPILADIDNIVPRVGDESVEWLTSFDQGMDNSVDSSSDEEEDEADVFGTSFMPKMDRSEEESIVFGNEGSEEEDTSEQKKEESTEPSTPGSAQETESDVEELTIKILYIQMEYCEKSTLRTCIDAGLPSDSDRMWRLFREICEGLVHIHGQGMIHRDLKPVNIFLDSQDHVKIGDFGLATTDILVKDTTILDLTLPSPHDQQVSLSHSGLGSGDGNLTGKVGTALYVSPEVMQGGGKVHYDQKVDIYSLGIMFFEMCYKCLPTGMERVKTLSNLRKSTIEMPDDFDKNSLEAQILRWLLDHDPGKRPTSKQLLTSDLLPLQRQRETEFSEMLRSTISNPNSSSYRHLLQSFFNQTVSVKQDVLYDYEISKLIGSSKVHLLHYKVEQALAKVFSNHGAVCGPSLPLFIPKCSLYESNEQHVRMMDQRGSIVSLPLDLRVPFARYVGRHNIQSMKRYTIEKVFREKKFSETHPRQLTECAFDIITTSQSLIADAEVLATIQEIIHLYPSLQARKYYIRINHISVLKAVLLHCGVPEHDHTRALSLLAEKSASEKQGISALQSELPGNLSEDAWTQLSRLLEIESTVGKVTSVLRCITKTPGQASSLAQSGLHDLKHVITHAINMGLKLQIYVTIGLVYNPQQYSGVLYQVMCDCRKRKKVVTEVLAAGGRYDKLIEKFPPVVPTSGGHSLVHGVGISIAVDRLVAIVLEDEQIVSDLTSCDIVVCTFGHKQLEKERLAVARNLWAAGLKADMLYDKVEDFDEILKDCQSKGITYLVVLDDSNSLVFEESMFPYGKQKKALDHSSFLRDEPSCIVKCIAKDSPPEIVAVNKLVEFLNQDQLETTDSVITAKSKDNTEGSTVSTNSSSGSGSGFTTNSSYSNNVSAANRAPVTYNFNMQFVPQDGKKYSAQIKRKQENSIAVKVPSLYPWIPEKNLEVLALDMPASSMKTIAGFIDLTDETMFEESKGIIIEKEIKLRKYLESVLDNIHNLRFGPSRHNFILLYSIRDGFLKLLIP